MIQLFIKNNRSIVYILPLLIMTSCTYYQTDPVTGRQVPVISIGSGSPVPTVQQRQRRVQAYKPAPTVAPRLSKKQAFLQKHRGGGELRVGSQRASGNMYAYSDGAGDLYSERKRRADRVVEKYVSNGKLCKSVKRIGASSSILNVNFNPSVQNNYMTFMCKGDCKNVYYKIFTPRHEVKFYGHKPYPEFWIHGSIHANTQVQVGRYLDGEFAPLSKATQVDVILWTAALFPRCSYRY